MPCGRNSTRWSRPPFGDPDATSALFHPADIRKVSTRHQIDIIQAFFKIHLCLEMKNKRALKIDKGAHFRARSEKSNLSKHLVNFWRDLEDDQHWKYDELSPLQLLEKLKPDECRRTRMNSHALNSFGVAGRASLRRSLMLLGLLLLWACHSGYLLSRQ